jgi:glycosyltransferase involved in cell wall biosynthesis
MRCVIVTSEPADVARASGTAVAVSALQHALLTAGVAAPVIRPRHVRPSGTAARWRFNRQLRSQRLLDVDAILGVNGDGWQMARESRPPFVALIKAFYAGAMRFERAVNRELLRAHAHWEAAGARLAAAVVVPSQFAAGVVSAEYGVERARVSVVPEPFDAARWRATLPQRARSGERVLCVAHLYPRKHVDHLLRAWPRVLAARPQARLDIIGDGPELRRLSHLARGMRNCYLHGHLEGGGLMEFHARSDVFCLPSAQETFGYAAVEAMASGLSLVVPDSGALAELSAGGVAEHVDADDETSIADGILRALQPDTIALARDRNPTMTERFAPHVVAQALVALVHRLAHPDQRFAAGSSARSAASFT